MKNNNRQKSNTLSVSAILESLTTLLNISASQVDNNSNGAKHQKPMERNHVDYERLLREEEE